MTRKSDPATSDRSASLKDLKTYRVQIDKLDLQILKLINERAELAARAAAADYFTRRKEYAAALLAQR